MTEALTLYAKREDGNGNEYLATEVSGGVLSTPVIVIGISTVLVAGTVGAGVFIVKRRK